MTTKVELHDPRVKPVGEEWAAVCPCGMYSGPWKELSTAYRMRDRHYEFTVDEIFWGIVTDLRGDAR